MGTRQGQTSEGVMGTRQGQTSKGVMGTRRGQTSEVLWVLDRDRRVRCYGY